MNQQAQWVGLDVSKAHWVLLDGWMNWNAYVFSVSNPKIILDFSGFETLNTYPPTHPKIKNFS
jgi:hypothetical protein